MNVSKMLKNANGNDLKEMTKTLTKIVNLK